MKSKIAIAVIVASLTTPLLWADEMNAGGTSAPNTTAADTQSPNKATKKHHGGKHHKKMKKSAASTETPAAPAAQ